ncbi:hypothetical protein EV02_1924 [Prochlorococcus marinus str. SB]|uniref:Uncharacterized protein n=1 Tax=Prochlorococcus marinus str. SB TaxID=59926 RepID=A0A0A2B9D0_PROMR|nr:hypothetical protein EV02_1924 [Prochlorococcus marinus str. SB]
MISNLRKVHFYDSNKKGISTSFSTFAVVTETLREQDLFFLR